MLLLGGGTLAEKPERVALGAAVPGTLRREVRVSALRRRLQHVRGRDLSLLLRRLPWHLKAPRRSSNRKGVKRRGLYFPETGSTRRRLTRLLAVPNRISAHTTSGFRQNAGVIWSTEATSTNCRSTRASSCGLIRTVQVGDLAGERSATLIENQRREIEHLKLQRENAQMRATLAEQSSGSHRGGSVKSIPDMLGDGY